MKQFEYCYVSEWSGLPKEIIFSNGQHKDISNMKRVDLLGILGSEGWEMVGTARTKEYAGSTLKLYFKIELTN
jgi:hypothetical protein